MYQEYVYHLDLCVLAYQLYNQTLIFPLDPWYERMARTGTSRRDNFMKEVHTYVDGKGDFRGPGSTRGWPNSTAIDPIVGQYKRISPWRACFTRDDSKYRVFNAPSYITDEISDVYMCEYQSNPAGDNVDFARGKPIIQPVANQQNTGNGDALYAFEGGTGATVAGKLIGAKPAAWSLMGYVLVRRKDGGKYDLHIAFRGSQSGSAGRELVKGMIQERGNADWITDMDLRATESYPQVSAVGQVSRGFANSVKLSLNSIVACLADIDGKAGAPQAIYVTGHSLGGALAAQFSAAMVLGEAGTKLPGNVKNWPWRTLRLITYGAPTVGDSEFASALNWMLDAKRIWVEGDPITQGAINFHVGSAIRLDGGYLIGGPGAHEPAKIRECLIQMVQNLGGDLTNVPAQQPGPDEPWKDYATFSEMYEDHAVVKAHLAEILTPDFAANVDLFIDLFRNIIPSNSTYRSPMTRKSVSDKLLGKLNGAFGSQADSVDSLRNKVSALSAVLDDQDDYLGLSLTLREVLRPNASVTIDQVMQDEALKDCFSC